MKPEYKKKAGRSTRDKKNGRAMRKNSPRIRAAVVDLDVPAVVPVTVNRITCCGNTPGGYRVESVPVQPGERI
jgi:hypothetical protein